MQMQMQQLQHQPSSSFMPPAAPMDASRLRLNKLQNLPPGTPHEIENTGAGRLYCLTFMAPDDGFAALIRNGEPVALDEEDLAVIAGMGPARLGGG